jgi:hypothetical protein
MTEAWGQAGPWLDCAVAWIPPPTERHRTIPESLLAAPAIEHGPLPYSTDGHFARYPNLRRWNPLSA